MGKKITDKEKEKVVRLVAKYTGNGDNPTMAYKKTVLATGISEPSVIAIWKEYNETAKENN